MSHTEITERDRRRAEKCLRCPACRRARARQGGWAFWLVKRIESKLCPWCRAYERVYGRKAHEPIPPAEPADN